jgi:cellulose synthase/poly-beta-1,6-N-acetylglucosamine synthase-like glycosyltransferase
VIAIAPPSAWLPSLGRIACLKPDLMRKVVITTPAVLRAARGDRSLQIESGRLMPLHGVPRRLLADQVATRGQVAALGAALALLAVGLVSAPVPVFAIFLLIVNLALLAHASTRGVALFDRSAPRSSRRPRAARGSDEELPVYSILVPLYREHGVVPQLVQALAAIDYPRDRLDIQFLLEADDTETLAAVERCAAGLGATITVVPPGGPRTKPKALNVGLRRACGEIVTVFDAEDRPDPQQLRLAAAAFRAAPRSLAVLQARLIIDHAGENWLTSMFAIEYAIQFDALLPMVARRDGLFLLGGTSNHFRGLM